MEQPRQLKTAPYVVHADDSGDRVGRRDTARDGRAAAMLRRRQLSQGKQALKGGNRTAAAGGAGAPVFIVHPGGGG